MKRAVSLLFLLSSAAVFAQFSLTTQFASNNGFAGNTFDLVSTSDIVIDGFDVNISDSANPQTVTVYYKLGTSVGFENTPGAWTMLGVDNSVTVAGLDLPSSVAVGGLAMDAGQVYGIYIDLTSYATDGAQPGDFDDGTDGGASSVMNYTNGGPTPYTDGVLTITTNTGQSSPAFGGSFFPREWNGTVYYSLGNQVPTMSQTLLIGFSVLLGLAALGLARRRSAV